MSLPTADLLIDDLRKLHLLRPEQLDELTRVPSGFPTEPKALARELIQRGWLTPFQANHLLQGRGEELALGAYVLLERVGEGGMGQVYKARNWKLDKVVALKVVRKERLDEDNALQRFQREIRAAAQLSHPNVVHAFDADEAGGTLFFAMELVAGTDLTRRVKQSGPLPWPAACDCVRQAALGLQHAHERGLVHRDVKPSNLLVTPGGEVKVLDLGLALLNRRTESGEDSGTLTMHGTVMGTLDFIAPEQARNSHVVDHRADLYSLGCALYFLLTGRPPFPDASPVAKLTAHLFDEPRPVEELAPETPPAVGAVVRKLMAKKPEDRFQSAGELAAELAAILSGSDRKGVDATVASAPLPADLGRVSDSTATDAAPTTPPQGRPPSRRKSRWLFFVAAAVLLGGLLGALALWLRERPRPAPPPDEPPPATRGELVLENADPGVRIRFRRAGESEKPGVLRAGGSIALAAGDYDLSLDDEGLAGLRLSRTTVTLADGKREGVRVEGAPLSPWAWVSRPAYIEGVRGWTLTSRTGRGPVERLAYSPDGRRLAVVNQDGVVRVFDAASGRLDRAFVGHAGSVVALAWSPDKDAPTLASASTDGTVRLWDPATGRPGRVQHLAALALAWSPDGKTLACAVDNDVILWDLATDKVNERLQKHGAPIRALAWSPVNGVLASAGDKAGVVLWRKADTGWVADVREGHTKPVRALAWSPDGKVLASAGDDGAVCRWREDGLAPIPALTEAKGGVYSLAWSPDGKTLAAGAGIGGDGTIRLWDLVTGAPAPTCEGPTWAAVNTLAWPAGGTLTSGGSDRLVHFWDTQKGKTTRTLSGHNDLVFNTVWAPDGARLAADGESNCLRIWDAATGERLRESDSFGTWTYGAAWAPDGKRLTASAGAKARLWDLETGRLADFGDGVTRTAWAPGGSIVATSGGRVLLRDAAAGEVKLALVGPPSAVALVWSPNGRTLAGAAANGVIFLWDGQTGAGRRQWANQGKVLALAWAPDDRRLASAGDDGIARIWDLESPATPRLLRGHKGAVRGVTWLSGGKKLATLGDDDTLRFWDAETGELERTVLRGAKAGAFSPDGGRIADGNAAWTLRLWETASGRPLGTVVQLVQGWVVLSEDGHYRCENAKVEEELVAVVQTEQGQETLGARDFARKYGRINDPIQARLDTRPPE